MSFLPSALDTKKGTQGNTVPLDPTLLDDLERHAAQIALDLSKMLGNLQEFMAEISAHTLQSVDVHKMAVDNLCEAVEDSMRGTVDLINKVDELSHDMSTVQALSAQIALPLTNNLNDFLSKHIKESLDFLDSLVK